MYQMLTNIKWCHVTENALYCVVNGIFPRNIHSEEKLIGTPSKEVLYLDVGIAKKCFGNNILTTVFAATDSSYKSLNISDCNCTYFKCSTRKKHIISRSLLSLM